ncbi:MAG: hypothetical protein FJ023_09450 [Chloroflexi bacterium]|nr:hypothetical protein [Chloroflexota bacterium]
MEELRIPAWPGAPLLLDKFKTEDIASLLQLREKDQVYVAMAVCETLHEWEIIDPKRSGEIRNDLLEFCLRTFSQDELQAIKDLLELLELSKGKNILEVVQRLEEMSTSNNTFTRIAACRNVLLISDRFPSKALNLMRLFIDPGQHKHVRRPVAREESAAFLIKMIASKDCSLQANEILWDLLKDKDSTIRIAAFDMAEMLRDKNKDMLLQVCDFIAANESSAILMERAQHVRQELLTDSG